MRQRVSRISQGSLEMRSIAIPMGVDPALRRPLSAAERCGRIWSGCKGAVLLRVFFRERATQDFADDGLGQGVAKFDACRSMIIIALEHNLGQSRLKATNCPGRTVKAPCQKLVGDLLYVCDLCILYSIGFCAEVPIICACWSSLAHRPLDLRLHRLPSGTAALA
jgi:hypothetical protein